MRFEPLLGSTLFKADSLDAKLPNEIEEKLREQHFDAVVGKPPWKPMTLDAGQMDSRGPGPNTQMPHHYPDLKFLQLANKLTAGVGRVGMVVKSTPFFSLSPRGVKARNELIDNHKPCALINLSHVRREGLFPDSIAPATLFFSRCKLMTKNNACLVGSIPWSPDFARTGVFHVDPDAIHTVTVAYVRSKPWLLKALALGSVRDNWLLYRWERAFPTLEQVLDQFGILRGVHRGPGFSRGARHKSPEEYFKYPTLTSRAYTPFRLDVRHLPKFCEATLGRVRDMSIFRAPLVLCRASLNVSCWEDAVRYVASTCDDDVLYDSNFFGISCAILAPEMVKVLAAILSSSVTTLQLMLKSSCLGVKGTALRFQDLCSLRVPPLHSILEGTGLCQFGDLIQAEQNLARSTNDGDCRRALDEEVYKIYDIRGEDQTVIDDYMNICQQHLGSRALRSQSVQPPTYDSLRAYGHQVTKTMNAYLRALGRQHLEATVYCRTLAEGKVSPAVHGLAVVRFSMVAGPPGPTGIVREGVDSDLERVSRILCDEIESGSVPHLHEQRNLRLYNGDEVFFMKPNETRYWTRTAAINDADAILDDHWGGNHDSIRA